MRRGIVHSLAGLAILLLAARGLFAADAPAPDAGGNIETRIREVARAVAAYARDKSRAELCVDGRLAEALLQLEKVQLLSHRYQPNPFVTELQNKQLDTAAGILANLEKSAAAKVRTGFRERAYIADTDLSVQPYLVYVPSTYDATKPYPLLMFLHGYAYDLDKVNWAEYMYSLDLQKLAEDEGYLVVLPYGRSNTEFMGIGEVDVLHVLDLMKRDYKVDDARVILSGASMGGSGAYSIACHYPQLFAGCFVITARVDYYVWMGIEKDTLPVFKQVQTDLDYARELLGNLSHIPVHIFHGRLDPLLNVKQSRLMAQLLRERGQNVRYIEFPEGDHYIWGQSFSHPSLREWLKTCRRPAAPRKVSLRTFSTKYGRAHWVEVRRIEHWAQPADVEADFGEEGVLRVTARNVADLRLTPPAALWGDHKTASLIYNDQPPRPIQPADGAVVIAAKPDETRLAKTAALCGPAREAYCSRFIIVYGIAGDAAADDLERGRAKDAAQEWAGWSQGVAEVKADAAVTDDDIAGANLVLYGTPWDNALVKKIADRLPISIEPEAYVIGKRRIDRKGAGLMMLYPNPLNPKRYVLVCDGERWGRSLSINHKLDFVPDFIVFTQDVDRDGTMFQTNKYLCAGYFDSDWRLSDASTWWRPKEKAGAEAGEADGGVLWPRP